MSINSTTLSAAITATQTNFGVASASNINAPNYTNGLITYLLVEQELMAVTAVSGTQVTVRRGVEGTQAVAHVSGTLVVTGNSAQPPTPGDFPIFTPPRTTDTPSLPARFQGVSAPVASASTITPTGPVFHVTGTTTIETINLPPNFVEGRITIIFDGVAPWGTTGNIKVAGTPTTAGAFVDFLYDASTSLWYPSHLA